MTKNERIAAANGVARIIGSHGRRFFYYGEADRFGHFETCWQGRLWWRDEYTDRRISLHRLSGWRGFTNGGTLQSIVKALAHYIKTGEQMTHRYFGPWPDHYCNGDVWGYGKPALAAMRDELAGNPAITQMPESADGGDHEKT